VSVHVKVLPHHPKLGRNVEHDERSKRYLVEPRGAAVFAPVSYVGICPILDQKDLGACTGYASTALLGYIEPGDPQLPDTPDAWDALAKSVYSVGTSLDSISGNWPPTDTGSTGIAVSKALKQKGFSSGYKHITSAAALATALATGPVIVGTNWYNSMFNPNATGLIRVDKASGLAGGHEYVLDGVMPDGKFRFRNSWGTSFGVDGFFYMTQADFLGLLADEGDATQVLPASVPAPVPTPSPGPAPGPVLDTARLVAAYNELGKVLKAGGLL
jgi:hypothetical protein